MYKIELVMHVYIVYDAQCDNSGRHDNPGHLVSPLFENQVIIIYARKRLQCYLKEDKNE